MRSQTCVQQCLEIFFPFKNFSCAPGSLCPDFREFKVAYVQTIVRSELAMSRLSCVQSCLYPVYRAFIRASRPRYFERTTHPLARSFRSGHMDFRSGTSAWVIICQATKFIYITTINSTVVYYTIFNLTFLFFYLLGSIYHHLSLLSEVKRFSSLSARTLLSSLPLRLLSKL